jgi:putative ABC transport system permease protein
MMGDSFYRVLLRALPADLRQDCGGDMEALFGQYRRELAGHPLRLSRLWFDAVLDIAVQSAAERSAARQARAVPFSPRIHMRALLNDFRHGLRLLRRYPSTSLLAILTLAVGIGANTAIFSVVDRVLLRALPYPEPDQLAMVFETREREGRADNPVSAADFLDWRRLNQSFAHMAASAPVGVSLTGDGEPVQIGAAVVSASFFDVFGVQPAAGRTFQPGDEVLGQHRVVVLSHGLWQRRYGGDRSVIGRTLTLNGTTWQVVGVLPADYQPLSPDVELWAPMVLSGLTTPPSRVSHGIDVYARLRPGVSLAQAKDEMVRIGRQLQEANPQENRGHGAIAVSMRERFVGPVRNSLVLLFAAVGFVLLIACVNVASLLVSRALSRSREMAVRSALGANRRRLVVQSLVESVALASTGGIAGLGVAFLTIKALPTVMPERVSLVGIGDLELDLRVLVFMAGLSLATGVLFGLLPALHASKPQVADALKEGGRGAAGVRGRVRFALVVGEVALAALTLMGAGLAIRSFGAIMAQPLGFEPRGKLSMTLSVPQVSYPTPEARRIAMAALEHRLATVPGVTSVGAVDILPLGGGDARRGFGIEGVEPTPDNPRRMHPRVVTPTYFATMGIPIISGRGFTADDHANASPVVVITEASVRRFWPDKSPLGTRIALSDGTWRTIVGVAGDVQHWGLTVPTNPMLYLPQEQFVSGSLTFVLKTDLDPLSLTSAARGVVAEIDPNIPIGKVTALEDLVATSVRAERAQTVLMAAFGVLALALAVVGIYGVMAQLALSRVHEIGVRMALGARPVDVLRQLLFEGFLQTAAGLVLGIGVGLYVMRFATALLFGIEPADGITLIGVSVTLMAAALAACLVPARRAMRVDPVEALRGQ